jgi:hypothetical protein
LARAWQHASDRYALAVYASYPGVNVTLMGKAGGDVMTVLMTVLVTRVQTCLEP